MKTKTKNMFLIAAAFIFLSTGVSCVHDLNGRHYYPEPSWNTQEHFHQALGYHPYGSENHFAGHESQRYQKTYYDKQRDYPDRFHKDH
jgi:hypothetical protein